jgi:hypothetical protein
MHLVAAHRFASGQIIFMRCLSLSTLPVLRLRCGHKRYTAFLLRSAAHIYSRSTESTVHDISDHVDKNDRS